MDRSRNFNLYLTFFTLYKTLNMRKAAELLDLSSHALISKNIKQMEFELGVKLFETGQHGVSPTTEADKLYMTARSLFAELEMIETNIKQLSTPKIDTASDNPMDVHLVIAGGTIDGELSPLKGEIVPLEQSLISEYLKNYANPHLNILETKVTLKDSRHLNQDDLSKILKTVMHSSHENILISHGIYTIANTAKYIRRFQDNLAGKKIFLIGSFYPIKGSAMTDATFNLGYAVASFSHAKPGVYIIVQGKIFNPDDFKVEYK